MTAKQCDCQNTEPGQEAESKPATDERDEGYITLKRDEYEGLIAKCKDAEEKFVYACADFDNFKKRNQKHLHDQVRFANEGIIQSLLPIVDNLRLANIHACSCTDKDGAQLDDFIEGVNLIYKQMMDVFSKYGVEEIDAVGKLFDPRYHEAMDQRDSEEHEPGCVIEEYQKGYLMNGRLLRSARVSVSKKKEGGE